MPLFTDTDYFGFSVLMGCPLSEARCGKAGSPRDVRSRMELGLLVPHRQSFWWGDPCFHPTQTQTLHWLC